MQFYGTSVNLDHIKLLPPTFGYIVLVCHPQINTLLQLTDCLYTPKKTGHIHLFDNFFLFVRSLLLVFLRRRAASIVR